MNYKLVFELKRRFDSDIILVANNHRDLESYLREECDFYFVETFNEQTVKIIEREGLEPVYASLRWAIHI